MPMSNDASQKKGRPTPKRKEAQSKRIVSSLAPASSKEEKKRAREQSRASRNASRAAYLRGEESALPLRDKGPARKYVRNLVDSRKSIGEYFLPIIFVVLLLSIFPVAALQYGGIALMYAVLLTAVIDGIFLSRKIKREVRKRFPDASTKGLGLYGWLRSTQMRRLRTPHPQVKSGDTF
jgi:Protein of unknown function (DUF3043)